MMNFVFKSGFPICFRMLLMAALWLTQGFSLQAQDKSLVAIANQTGAPASLKMSELKAVMMGEKERWKSGNRIRVALLKTNTPLGKKIAETVLDMSADELNRYWLGLVFQGKAQAPAFFSTIAELEIFVSQNPGAIGISSRQPALEEIRVVPIDGQNILP